MSENGGNSPVRSAPLPALPVVNLAQNSLLQREASSPLPLPLDGQPKSAHTDSFSLPIVHAAVTSGKGSSTPVFSSHSLLVNSAGITLTSHETQEEIILPISTVFDIFPVTKAEDSDHLFLSAPTPNLLQVLSTSRRPAVGNSQPPEAVELTVTLALASLAECTRLVARLSEARQTLFDGSTPQSVSSSSPVLRSSPTLSPLCAAPPSPLRVPEERDRPIGLASEFAALYVQALPMVKACLPDACSFDQNGYRPCDLHISPPGFVIEHTPAVASQASGTHGPWSIPWAALMEVRMADATVEGEQPPSTHPQVLRLNVASRAGLTGSTTCCSLNVAADSPVRAQSLLRALKAHQNHQFPARSLRPSAGVPGPGASLMGGGSTASRNTGAELGAGPPNNRVSVQVSSIGAPPGGVKESEALHMVHINNIPVQLTPTMASLLMSYQPEDSKQPDPFEISKASVLLPTVPSFQRCTVLIDKLGLSVTPLVAAGLMQERGRSGARALKDEGGVLSDYALMTEALHFPISALVDVAEEPELKRCTLPTLPVDVAQPPPAVGQPAPAANAGSGGGGAAGGAAGAGPTVGGQAAATGGATGSSGSRRQQQQPFARSLAPWEKPSEHSTEKDKSGVPEPPYPYLVEVRVKGALAGRLNGAEKTPIHLRLNAQPPPPVAIVFSVPERDKALKCISAILAFKKYHLSIALSTYLNTLTAVSQRQSERRGARLPEEGVVAQRMMGQAAVPSVEPPPLPPRPADLPQANRLPRMVTNDEGEVFWYIPRKQKSGGGTSGAAPTGATATSGRPMPVPQPDADTANPPPPDPSPRDGQASATAPTMSLQPAASAPAGPARGGDFLGSLDISATRPQTPPRSAAARPSPQAGPAAGAAGSASPGAGPVSSSSATAPAPMTPTRAAPAAAPFDDGCDVVDTPAPCLTSPTPTPGRR